MFEEGLDGDYDQTALVHFFTADFDTILIE